jgi:hypothetical protein
VGDTRNDGRARRAVPHLVVVIAVVGASLFWLHGTAHAAITTFSMSPTSGPPGTTVNVNGSGCSPGLILSSADRVTLAATTIPPVVTQIATTSSGSWSGSFTIPNNAVVGSALVNVVCFTDGLQSLLTIYTSQTFTVTQVSAPTTTVATTPTTSSSGTTPPGATATTAPKTNDANEPPGPSDPGDATDAPDPSEPGPGDSDDDVAPGTGGGKHASERPGKERAGGSRGGISDDASAARTTARAAALQSPELSALRHEGSGGTGWVAWLLVVLVIVGGGLGAYLWHRTRPGRLAAADADGDAEMDTG